MIDDRLLKRTIKVLLKTGGISVDLKLQKFLPTQDWWMFPKYPSKTRILSKNVDLKLELRNFIKDNFQALTERDTYLGIWLNPKTEEYYFDITTAIEDKDQALNTAREVSMKEGRNIVAIYNPQKGKTIFL